MKLYAKCNKFAIIRGSLSNIQKMNDSKKTPFWKAVTSILSSNLSTNKVSLLKQLMKDYKLSLSPCSICNKLDVGRLCL